MKNKFLYSSIILTTLLNAIETPPMPPMMPQITPVKNNIDTKQSSKKQQKKAIPKSCELIPPMVIFLPPPMEKELVNCKNNLHKPKKDFVEKQLSKLFKKKVKVQKVEIVEKFNQLYKITYSGGVILVNKDVNAFIKQ